MAFILCPDFKIPGLVETGPPPTPQTSKTIDIQIPGLVETSPPPILQKSKAIHHSVESYNIDALSEAKKVKLQGEDAHDPEQHRRCANAMNSILAISESRDLSTLQSQKPSIKPADKPAIAAEPAMPRSSPILSIKSLAPVSPASQPISSSPSASTYSVLQTSFPDPLVPTGEDHLQIVFLQVAEFAESKSPLPGKIVPLQHCMSFADIHASITQQFGYLFPQGDPPAGAFSIRLWSRMGGLASPESTRPIPIDVWTEHDLNKQWQWLSLPLNMSGFKDVPYVHVDFRLSGYIATSPPTNKSNAYFQFANMISRKIKARSEQPQLVIPTSFVQASMQQIIELENHFDNERTRMNDMHADSMLMSSEFKEHLNALRDVREVMGNAGLPVLQSLYDRVRELETQNKKLETKNEKLETAKQAADEKYTKIMKERAMKSRVQNEKLVRRSQPQGWWECYQK